MFVRRYRLSSLLYIAFCAGVTIYAFSSCAQEEEMILSESRSSNCEIKYNLTSEETTSLPASMLVSAFRSDTKASFFESNRITRNDGTLWSSSDNSYWPQHCNLHFFAHSHGKLSYDSRTGCATFRDYSPAEDVNEQKPLIYGASTNLNPLHGPTTREAVERNKVVNFRLHHALAQVAVKVANASAYDVEVSAVKVGNVVSRGTFSFGSVSRGAVATAPGSWELSDLTASYEYILPGDETLNLSHGSSAAVSIADGLEAFNLLPQTRSHSEGAYMAVYVTLTERGTSHATVYKDYAVIPMDIDWKAGQRYVYTIRLGGSKPTGALPTGIDYTVTTSNLI